MSNGDRVAVESAEQGDVERLKDAVRQYVVPFSVAAVVVLVVTGAWTAYRSHVRRGREEAAIKLSEARTGQELESIVADYPKSPSAPLALLKLAKLHYSMGAYETAAAKYAEFKKRYPNHEMGPGAEIGRIHCLEAQG
ncbi:MAG: tetratricopeptide repeat protein, partial [Kiritimatiellae bacterium]|nr:tetratricopeptide repeat protein [Kiritimatiellia bacterium]